MNLSLMHHVNQVAWWDINHREDDCFLDSDKYGYVASQLTHIPQLIGYDYGNVLMYNKKQSHTQLDSRKQVIAFQDRVMTINIKEAQHPLNKKNK